MALLQLHICAVKVDLMPYCNISLSGLDFVTFRICANVCNIRPYWRIQRG